MSEWTTRPLGDFLELITYGFTNPMPTTDSGPLMITAKDINGGRVNWERARHTSDSAFDRLLTNKSRPRIGDVLLTKDGSIGRVAVCDRGRVCINQSVALLRPNFRTDPRFLSYLLQAPRYQAQMESDSDGSTIKHIYITRVDKMPVLVPDFNEQQAIAEVLGALDDKIAANVEVTESADRLRLIRYGAMKKTDSRPLSGLARFVNGRAFTKGASGAGRVVVRIAELNSGIGGSTVFSDAEVPADHEANPGDLLFAWSGSLTLHRWYRDQAIVNQHIFKVVADQGYPLWLVAGALDTQMEYFRGVAADKATTMGHIQRRHLDELVAIPSNETVRAEDEAMRALWDSALSAERENAALAATRDALLPQLMSGKLRVKEAAKKVEALV